MLSNHYDPKEQQEDQERANEKAGAETPAEETQPEGAGELAE